MNADCCSNQKGIQISEVHDQAVNCVTFDRYNPSRLLSTSFDGCVRYLDLNTAPTTIFDKVLKAFFRYFEYLLFRNLINVRYEHLIFMEVLSLDGDRYSIHPIYHAQKDASTILVSQCK